MKGFRPLGLLRRLYIHEIRERSSVDQSVSLGIFDSIMCYCLRKEREWCVYVCIYRLVPIFYGICYFFFKYYPLYSIYLSFCVKVVGRSLSLSCHLNILCIQFPSGYFVNHQIKADERAFSYHLFVMLDVQRPKQWEMNVQSTKAHHRPFKLSLPVFYLSLWTLSLSRSKTIRSVLSYRQVAFHFRHFANGTTWREVCVNVDTEFSYEILQRGVSVYL